MVWQYCAVSELTAAGAGETPDMVHRSGKRVPRSGGWYFKVKTIHRFLYSSIGWDNSTHTLVVGLNVPSCTALGETGMVGKAAISVIISCYTIARVNILPPGKGKVSLPASEYQFGGRWCRRCPISYFF